MDVTFTNQIPLHLAYGILCGPIGTSNLKDALMPTFCQIPTKGFTTPHRHFESEIFYIIKGSGLMSIDNESRSVSVGDLIRIPASSDHSLLNTSDEALEFLSVYSEDFEIPPVPNKTIITAAPPTPNGPMHLGHISGPYLASDILARYIRSHSMEVTTHSGTDDHQNYVAEKAYSLKQNVDAFQKNQRTRILGGLKNLSITFDEFIEPKSDHAYQFKVLSFVERAINSGVIEKEIVALPHCHHCDLTLVDTLADGLCPNCHSPSRGGCETCGLVVQPNELLNVHCGRCGKSGTVLRSEVYTFNLSRYLPSIRTELNRMRLPPRLKDLIQKVDSIANYKVLVSHPNNNHMSLKMPNSQQSIHVWFEMAAHYERFSLSSTNWIHCFGFDNSFHYLIFVPALLRAMNPLSKLPNAVVTNEFLLLDGLKFSTSRNHAIWSDEVAFDTDVLRLYLASQRPSKKAANFSLSEFEIFAQSLEEKINIIADRARVVNSSKENYSMESERDCQRISREISFLMSLESLDIRQAAQKLIQFIDHTVHELGIPGDDQIRIRTLAKLLKPFMPNTELI